MRVQWGALAGLLLVLWDAEAGNQISFGDDYDGFGVLGAGHFTQTATRAGSAADQRPSCGRISDPSGLFDPIYPLTNLTRLRSAMTALCVLSFFWRHP